MPAALGEHLAQARIHLVERVEHAAHGSDAKQSGHLWHQVDVARARDRSVLIKMERDPPILHVEGIDQLERLLAPPGREKNPCRLECGRAGERPDLRKQRPGIDSPPLGAESAACGRSTVQNRRRSALLLRCRNALDRSRFR